MERSCSRARSVSSCFCWSLRRWRFGIFFFGRWLSDLDSLAFSGVFTLEVVDIGFLIGDVGGVVNVRRQNAVAVAFVSSSFSLSSFSSSPPRNSTTTPPLCSSFRPASEVDKMSIGIFFARSPRARLVFLPFAIVVPFESIAITSLFSVVLFSSFSLRKEKLAPKFRSFRFPRRRRRPLRSFLIDTFALPDDAQ